MYYTTKLRVDQFVGNNHPHTPKKAPDGEPSIN